MAAGRKWNKQWKDTETEKTKARMMKLQQVTGGTTRDVLGTCVMKEAKVGVPRL
jgi:hypothetical protein